MSDSSSQSSAAANSKENWYGLSSEDATKKLGTTIDKGLSATEARQPASDIRQEYS